MGESPVFVAGLPRTGKTALRIALGAHPRLSMTRKTRMWTTYFERHGDLTDPSALDACLAAMMADPAVAKLLPDEMAIREEFDETGGTYADLFGVIHVQYARRLGKPRWGEQMAGLEGYADAIFETWPDARMIHMVRHPAAWIEAGAQTRPGGVGRALSQWVSSARRALQSRVEHPDSCLVIRMEEMMAQPAGTLQDVATFIDETITFEIGKVLVGAMSSRVSAPLGAAARRYVEERVGDLAAALGYPPTEAGDPTSSRFGDAAALWFGLGQRHAVDAPVSP